MSLQWPEALWLLAAVPLLVALYVALLRRRKKLALRYASLSLVKEAMTQGQRFRRHVPPLLFLVALTLMIVAIARPTAVVKLPTRQETVILAIDVSGSMRAKDVEPNRLVAAQNAAKAFIADLPPTTRIGVVAFAGTANVVQSPTHSREDVVAAIDRFQLQRGTATGSGLLVALDALFPDAGIDVSAAIYGPERDFARGRSLDSREQSDKEKPEFKPVPPGSYTSAAIILLSDGQRTTGPDPLKAAKIAADRGVRVYTVGVGTVKGEVIGFEGWSFRAQLDEETLKAIAHMTAGEYFYAGNADELKKIYKTLTSRLVLEQKESEITALFAAAAGVLLLAAAGLSLAWFNRIL
jgi:Ca-activated chloride channel family protein